jgi:hypothetical protein
MKIGIECEGRLKGLRTLFVDAPDLLTLDLVIGQHSFDQLYISDLKNILKLDGEKLEDLAKEFFITVEVTELKKMPPRWINIILRLESPSLKFLWPTDQIKIEPIERNVFMIPLGQMFYTSPDEYRGDEIL